jgi:hypothetical protein
MTTTAPEPRSLERRQVRQSRVRSVRLLDSVKEVGELVPAAARLPTEQLEVRLAFPAAPDLVV